MSGHWHLMDRESPWTVERHPFPTMQAVIHVKSVRAALGRPDPAVLFQTETPQTCRWCAQPITEQAWTDQAIGPRVVATPTIPEHAPDGMLAVRVGSDPWTMVPLDEEQDTSTEGAKAVAAHFIAMSGSHGCLPDYCSVTESAEAAAEALGYVHELSPRDVRRLGNTGYLELGGPETGAEYAEIIECDCETPEDHNDA